MAVQPSELSGAAGGPATRERLGRPRRPFAACERDAPGKRTDFLCHVFRNESISYRFSNQTIYRDNIVHVATAPARPFAHVPREAALWPSLGGANLALRVVLSLEAHQAVVEPASKLVCSAAADGIVTCRAGEVGPEST